MNYLYTKPIEMPRGTHYGNNYWVYFSRKLGRRVTAFSNLEYENLITLEMNPDVVNYCEQPCEQIVSYDGGKYKTVFDAYVVYKDSKEELQEVKYQLELDDEIKGQRSREQIKIQKHWCLQNEFPYALRTDKEIEVGRYTVRNLTFLCAKARRWVPGNELDDNSFEQLLREKSQLTIGQLISLGRITAFRGLDYLADLYYRGIIVFDDIDNKPISNTTGVLLNGM